MYGRVFLGNTDGRVYAYDASSGALDWAVQTGAYVYASPAVTNAPGLGPTIYLGSYDGTFYALNARSGHIEWRYHAGGKISGSATIIGNIAYFADLGTHRTTGLGISTGKVVFTMSTGSFDPVISDNHYLYLSGITGLYALAPLDATPQRTRTPTRAPHTKAAAAAIVKAHTNETKSTKAKRVVVIHKSRPAQARAQAKSEPAHARRRGT
jgi:outer membrane protein assembly factor BamB